MSESTFNPVLSDTDVKLTDMARQQLARLIEDAGDDEIQGVRVDVSGGGCGGMTYGMTFTDRASEYDCVLQAEGVKLMVDTVALNFLRGVEIDYVERPMGASFVFNNVFASTGGAGTCGACGASGGGCG